MPRKITLWSLRMLENPEELYKPRGFLLKLAKESESFTLSVPLETRYVSLSLMELVAPM